MHDPGMFLLDPQVTLWYTVTLWLARAGQLDGGPVAARCPRLTGFPLRILIVTPRLEFPASDSKQSTDTIPNRYKSAFFQSGIAALPALQMELPNRQRIRRGPRQAQNAPRQNSKVKCPNRANSQSRCKRSRHRRGHVILRRLPEIHRDDHAQIIIGADHAVDRRNHHQPHNPRIERGLKREEFSEESARRRKAQQRQQEERKTRREHRLLRAEPAIVLNLEPLLALLPEMRQHKERANFHQRVRSEIKQNRRHAQIRCRRERHQDISRVRDRRIRQHPLHVRLHQRREISDAHRQHGRNPYGPEPQIARRAESHVKDAHHHRESRHLRSRREQRRHRRGRTLIHVRGINLKWRRYHFESEAHKHQPEAQNREPGWRRDLKCRLNRVNACGARRAVCHRDSVEKKCRRKGTQKKIFQRSFVGLESPPPESRKNVGRDRTHLQANKSRHQLVRARKNPHSSRCEKHQRVIFAALQTFIVEIFIRAENCDRRRSDHHHMHEDAERISANQPAVSQARVDRCQADGEKRCNRARQCEIAECPLPRRPDERIEHHNQDAGRAQNNLRCEPVEISELFGGNLHQGRTRAASVLNVAAPAGTEVLSAEVAGGAGRFAFCARPVICSSSTFVAGSIRRVKRGEAMPMNKITSAIVTRITRSRVEASGSVLFFSTVTSPSATRWYAQRRYIAESTAPDAAHDAHAWCRSNTPMRIRNSPTIPLSSGSASDDRHANRKNAISTGIGVASPPNCLISNVCRRSYNMPTPKNSAPGDTP